MFNEWLNHEIPNKSSLVGSTATATMVGIAANAKSGTIIGAVIIWITADMAIYQIRNKGETQ